MVQQPTRLQRLIQRIPATRLGSWYLSHTLHYVDPPLLRLSRGRLSLPGLFTGLPVVLLTTIGAKSGKPRTLPLVGFSDGDKVILVASYFGNARHPAWYHNLRAHPTATLSMDGQTRTYIARDAAGEEYDRYWRQAVDLYIGYKYYKERAGNRHIPIVVLSPAQ
jgi:deazaflavin-dependent oxidoreductase (nitroreductase family)